MNVFPIAFEDVVAARARLGRHLAPTPLRTYPVLDQALGLHVLVKHENHQPTNSFKIRNGVAALTGLPAEEAARGVIAATTGNHGQGLAWAGQRLGIRVTLCVPAGNNPEKNAAMRGFGARVVESGATYDDAILVMEELAADEQLAIVHSTNHRGVLAGAGTLSLELFEQAEAQGEMPAAIYMAVGGGSQAVGALVVKQRLHPKVQVIGVQAQAASAIHDSWKTGEMVVYPRADTFAEGVATRQPYELTIGALRSGLSDFLLASEAEIADAIRLLLRTTHNLAEGAGAIGLAGLRQHAERWRGKTVAIVLSGSNIDEAKLTAVLTRKL